MQSRYFPVDTPLGPMPPDEVIFGSSPGMRAVKAKLEKIAPAMVPVLIRGESGTGKDIAARFIHCRSPRSRAPFVKINCPAIPAALLESELFGYERGAFTGAHVSKPGWVEQASGGTLFLDEIAEMELALQSKLLHLLQNGQYARIGAQEDRLADVRVICATNRCLEQAIEDGKFRQDLFYRINVVAVELPPLRQRRADIPHLIYYFHQLYEQEHNRRVTPVSDELMQLLGQHDWPGNIRELENLVRRHVVLDSEEVIANEILVQGKRKGSGKPPAEGRPSLKGMTREVVKEVEQKLILEALVANNWNRKAAARELNISYRALFYKIKTAGIPPKRRFSANGKKSGAPMPEENAR